MINSVRNTVLSVLNKNNYGYISPSDFNLYAKQAQLEVYDEYFSNYNKLINGQNLRSVGSDFADITKAFQEVIETFLTESFLHPATRTSYQTGDVLPYNAYKLPSLITTGNEAYMFSKILLYTEVKKTGTSGSPSAYFLNDTTQDFTSPIAVEQSDFVLNATTYQSTYVTDVITTTSISLSEDIFDKDDKYLVVSPNKYYEMEHVSQGKISSLNASLLTAPSIMFPAYSIVNNIMYVYPKSIMGYGLVRATYFRYPKDPKWTYVTISNGEPAFDQSQPDYQDFELPAEDEYKLVMKILQYCGMSIREIQVAQFAIAQEQHEEPTFSQKQ